MLSWNSTQPCPSEKQTAKTTKGVYNRKENDGYVTITLMLSLQATWFFRKEKENII